MVKKKPKSCQRSLWTTPYCKIIQVHFVRIVNMSHFQHVLKITKITPSRLVHNPLNHTIIKIINLVSGGAKTDSQTSGSWSNSSPARPPAAVSPPSGPASPTWSPPPGQGSSSFQPASTNGAIGAGGTPNGAFGASGTPPSKIQTPPSYMMAQGTGYFSYVIFCLNLHLSGLY